jgi:hypothetical protein
MKRSAAWVVAVAAVVLTTVASLSADRVKLRTGQTVTGSFLSADVKMIRMLLANGTIAEFPVDTVAGIEFTPRVQPPAPAPDVSKPVQPVTVPAGTVLSVRLTQAIDVDAAHTGALFKSVLDDPVMIGGRVVIPRNTVVELQAASVEQAGTMKGADKITLKANHLAFGGTRYDIVTTYVEQKGAGEGKKTATKVGGGAGLGALIGGIAGGGKGVAIGAGIGAATGAIMSSQGTEHLQLPAETRMQFKLIAAVTVRP